jgi:two-component system chemotaxis response regulator CheB
MRKIKVLIVDDSALVRQTLTSLLEEDEGIEVLATAADPYIAAGKIARQVPDVITLDVEMPRMDGLTFLKKIMSQHPIPVIIISSLTDKGTETAIRALEYGAVEVLAKPTLAGAHELQATFREKLSFVIRASAQARIRRKSVQQVSITPKLSADAVLPYTPSGSLIRTTEKVVAIGASTGGTEALRLLLEGMPLDSPGMLIVQHMPEHFTRSFANRLNELCRVTVKEAENGDSVIRGRVLIAPGNRHMLLKRSGARYYVELNDGPPVNRHRPSVDVLFRSVAHYAGKNAVGILLTGMGNDGAQGLLEMKRADAYTIAQDERTCVVFGMPKEAIRLNAVDKVLPVDQISHHLLQHV